MKVSQILAVTLALISLALPACQKREEESESGRNKLVATSPKVQTVVLTEQYVCQIHAQRYIKICAMANGYLDAIDVGEGQPVKKGDLMFKIRPILYKARLDTELAEAKLAGLELNYTRKLYDDKVVSINEVSLYEAKLAKANAKAKLAAAELEFTDVKAPFDGIIDRLHMQLGSLIKEGEQLTTLSDNRLMWVYFNVPEKRYLDFKARQSKSTENVQRLTLPDSWVELVLADGSTFNKPRDKRFERIDTVTVEGKFNNETGNIPFRADFPNPDRLLRHGQTGKVVIHRTLKGAMLIPQRATFEILNKQYVYVIDKDNVIRQREIEIDHELDDLYVIKPLETVTPEDSDKEYTVGIAPDERFILEGIRQVQDGQTREYEFVKPEKAMSKLKYHAE